MTSEIHTRVSPSKTDSDLAERPRFQIQIVYGLLASFGGLVLLAVLVVLGLGMWSARQNTLSLLSDISLATREIIFARLEQHLSPAEDALRHLGRQMQDGSIDASDEQQVGQYLSGSLAATPQVRSIVYISDDDRMVLALRQERGVALSVVDVSKMPVIAAAVDEARDHVDVFWGEVIRPETAQATLLNARYPVLLKDGSLGVLAATVQIDQLSKILQTTAKTLGGRAFVLYGEQRILAHPSLITGTPRLSEGQVLPSLDQIGDPLVIETSKRGEQSRRDQLLEEATGIRMVSAANENWAVVTSDINRFGAIPWRIVVAFPAANIEEEFKRLRWAAAAGLAVLVVALILAYLLARYLSAPIDRLASAAERVRDLSLKNVTPLSNSLFREISSASSAFNSMIVGLQWFELYLPQKLVRQLVHAGGAGITESRQEEVTVMFTDIAGFTQMSSAMSADSTAAFLNDHFEMLGAAVEAEGGTIDKFIGDSLMAFWNAPEHQADHAGRACRSALAIREAIQEENVQRHARNLSPIQLRIGIHTGDVIVGNIGAPGRINYTIVGDAVNIANRIEHLGKEEAALNEEVVILVSAETMSRAGDMIESTELGARTLRGLEANVTVYKI